MPERNNEGLVIERIFNAPVALVWKSWSDPELLRKWWGPKDWTTPVISIDFKVGGKYLLCMRGAMGPGQPEMDTWSTGTYKEITPPDASMSSGAAAKIIVTDSFADEHGNVVSASHYGMPNTFPMEAEIVFTFEDLGNGTTKMIMRYPSVAGIEGEMLKNMTLGWDQSFDKLAAVIQ